MKDNRLILYKKNILTKILDFFKRIFSREKDTILDSDDKVSIYNKQQKEHFIENIAINDNEEEKRLNDLKLQYDNEKIDEEDLSDNDMDKLIEMYEKETEELNADTKKRKSHIAQMLKEFKN